MIEILLETAKVFSGFLTPLIGLLAAYIAWQQWNTRRDSLRLDLFDKRYTVYEGVKSFIEEVIREGHPTKEDIFDLKRKTHDVDFLFGEDIRNRVDEIVEKGARLKTLNEYLAVTPDNPEDKDREELIEEEEELLNWFTNEYTRTREKFAQYLKIDE